MKNKVLVLLVLLILPLISSTIVIQDNFEDIYNVGDLIDVNFSIQRSVSVSGFVEVLLDCEKDFTLKKDYVLIEANIKKYFSFESPLSLDGDCWIKVIFLNEEQRSPGFEVSDNIDIEYTLNDRFFLPYENLTINGSVKKDNGENYNGLLKVSIVDLDEKSIEVVNGNFYFNYEIKPDSFPKEYNLEITVLERDAWDNILNSGKVVEKIEIRPKATSLLINSTEELKPPFEFSFEVILLDQIGRAFTNETLVVKLKNPTGDIIFQKEVLSGEKVYYNFSGNSMKGGWNLNAYYGSLIGVKPVYIDENKEIFSSLSGNVLKFENVGNVLYEGIVKFSLGNEDLEEELFINISVPIGQTYDYPVYYVGEYNVSLDGEDFGFVRLTGYAISDNFELSWKNYILFGGIILFLVLVWFFVFKKKVFRNLGEDKIHERVEFVKEVVIPETRKLIVKEVEEEKVGPVNKKTYILFFESSANASSFEGIVENYGYKMNKVNENVGYTLFYEKEGVNSESKLYNLAKAIMRFSQVKGEKMSIVINRGQFEGKINLLKKFALLNRSLLKYADGQILMTRKFYDFLKLNIPKRHEVVEILDRKLEVYLVEN